MEAACLQLDQMLFQIFVLLNEKDFWSFVVLFYENLRSVDVLRKLYEEFCEIVLNKMREYREASSFKLSKTIILDSISIVQW